MWICVLECTPRNIRILAGEPKANWVLGESSRWMVQWLITIWLASPLSVRLHPFHTAFSWLINGGYYCNYLLSGMILQVYPSSSVFPQGGLHTIQILAQRLQWFTKLSKLSIKDWMGLYQQTPKEVTRAIRYAGSGVRSVGPVGDFLEVAKIAVQWNVTFPVQQLPLFRSSKVARNSLSEKGFRKPFQFAQQHSGKMVGQFKID